MQVQPPAPLPRPESPALVWTTKYFVLVEGTTNTVPCPLVLFR